MSQNIIILIGPPGGGKGSLSKMCIDRFNWLQLSTGNLCRDHISRQTEIGKKIDLIIKSGKLISDDLIIDMVEDWLQANLSSRASVIFDGYPRTIVQVKAFHDLLNKKFKSFKINLIRLLVNEDNLIKRLTARIVCSNNKCQTVYSTEKNSSLESKEFGLCDKCQSKLVKRDDDKEEAIRERLNFYKDSEAELLNCCKQLGYKVGEIDANRPIDNVFDDLKRLIN